VVRGTQTHRTGIPRAKARTKARRARAPRRTGLTTQERRIHKLADALVPKLKRRRCLELKGGRWEIGYDFASIPRLVWIYSAHRKEPFAIVPDRGEIIGLGALQYGYAEKKLKAAVERVGTKRTST